MYQQGRPRMANNQSHRMKQFQRNSKFVPRGREPHCGPSSNYAEPSPLQGCNENNWCEISDKEFSTPEMLVNRKEQHQLNPNFIPRGRGPSYGTNQTYCNERCETYNREFHTPDMLENHKEQHQHLQRYRNFGSRGRGSHYGSSPKYCRTLQSGNEENWCETCDRGFPSPDMLENHKQQHQKCNIDGCQFVAHPKIITKHIQMQHSTGLFKKIANLKNPEEIQKWREERKNNYPTKKNVEKKIAENKEKIERGEKMGLKRDRKFKNGENQKRKHPRVNEYDKRKNNAIIDDTNLTNTDGNNKKRRKKCKKDEMLPTPENIRKLKPFAGILDLVMDSSENCKDEDDNDNLHYKIEDDDTDCVPNIAEVDSSMKTEKPKICGALSSLMCEYGSSDDEIETQNLNNKPLLVQSKQLPDTTPDSKIKEHKSDHLKTATLHSNKEHNSSDNNVHQFKHENDPDTEPRNGSDNDDPPEEVKVEKLVENEANEKAEKMNAKINKSKKIRNKSDSRNKRLYQKLKPKLPSTLLQKLLHREIQQERNIVLQCIRHIVKNNYFYK